MKWKNDITKMLKVEYPILQAPMFGVTTPEMVASASNIDCLGSLALADLSAEQCVAAIQKTKLLTSKPFAVNIFVYAVPPITHALKVQYAAAKNFIETLAEQNDLEVKIPDIEDLKINSYEEQLEAVIHEKCKILSFTFGNLDDESSARLKNNGTILIGTCTSVNEARILEKSGIDIICVQGLEAGGHRGSFTSEEIPEIGGLSLLAAVTETINKPVIYAGGIYNAKTLLASKALGAKGFQIGSLLLGSAESALNEFEKERLKTVTEDDIILTKSFSGRYARGIKNTFIEATENSGFILPYPYQNKLTAELRRVARASKNADFVNIWAGQSISAYSSEPTSSILKDLIKQSEITAHENGLAQ